MRDEFIFTLSRRRKYPALRINGAGELEFLAPFGFSLETARKLVSKNPEIVTRLRQRHSRQNAVKPVWKDGMTVYWYGKPVSVHFTDRAHAVTDSGLHVPGGGEKEVRAGLAKLYKSEAQRYLSGRTAEIAGQYGVQYHSVSIGGAAHRWGSCSRDGRLRYSWKLIQCSPELIDYVIIHELAHRSVFDHSPSFWQKVKRMKPDFQELRKKLRDFSKKIELL